jgi:hypothetical protein
MKCVVVIIIIIIIIIIISSSSSSSSLHIQAVYLQLYTWNKACL